MKTTTKNLDQVAQIWEASPNLAYSHLTRTLTNASGTQVFGTIETDSEGVRIVQRVDDILGFEPAHRWIVALADVDIAEHDHGVDSTQARAARYVLDMLRKQQ
jgi:hypothetical protein